MLAQTHTPSLMLGLWDKTSSDVPPTGCFCIRYPNPTSQRCGLAVGGGGIRGAAQKGKKKGERGPILEEPLSAGGGQPKGRILVLESGRGEEG